MVISVEQQMPDRRRTGPALPLPRRGRWPLTGGRPVGRAAGLVVADQAPAGRRWPGPWSARGSLVGTQGQCPIDRVLAEHRGPSWHRPAWHLADRDGPSMATPFLAPLSAVIVKYSCRPESM